MGADRSWVGCVGAGEGADKPELADRPLCFLHRFSRIVKSQHRHTLQSLRIGLTEVVQPIVVRSGDGGGQFWFHILPHHDAEAD